MMELAAKRPPQKKTFSLFMDFEVDFSDMSIVVKKQFVSVAGKKKKKKRKVTFKMREDTQQVFE